MHGVIQDGDRWVCDCASGPSCNRAGKHPVERGWQDAATTDQPTIRRWLRRWPTCNFGALTTDIATVDVDPRNGGSLESIPSWVPYTPWVVRTGGGGWHLGFRSNGRVRGGNQKLGPGVDLKASGMLVVLPGSRHVQGRLYSWADEPPETADAVPTWSGPDAASESHPGQTGATATPSGQAPTTLAALLASPAAPGGRNDWLTRVAGFYAKTWPGQRDSYETHVRAAADLLPSPLDNEEVTKVLDSIWSAEQQRDRPAEVKTKEQAEWDKAVAAEVRRLRIRAEAQTMIRLMDLPSPPLEGGRLSDFLAQDNPPPDWVVDELLPVGGNVLLAAQYKAGKTTLLWNLARSFADDRAFLNQYKCAQMPQGASIALWDLEMSRALSAAWWSRLRPLRAERIFVAHLKGQRVTLDSAVRDVIERTVEWLVERRAWAWFIDPFARVFGGEEWDNSAAARFCDAIDEIKERAGLQIVAVAAHFGRKQHEPGAEHMRGPTRLDDWADVRWILTRAEHDRFFSADGRDVELDEQRILFESETLSLNLVEGSRSSRVQDRVKAEILKYLNRVSHLRGSAYQQAVTGKAIEANVQARRTAVSDALAAMAAQEILVVKRGPHNERWHYHVDHPEAGQGQL